MSQQCQVILNLKGAVESAVASVHTHESIANIEAEIYDHRQGYIELFHIPKTSLFRALSVNDLLLWTSQCSLNNEIYGRALPSENTVLMLAIYTHSYSVKKSSLRVMVV